MPVKLKPGIVVPVPVGELEPDVDQPRDQKSFTAAKLEAMADSLKIEQHHPVLVRQVGKRKIIFDGEFRWRAAKRGHIKTLKCLLKENAEDPVARGAGQIVTSMDRTPLNAIEMADYLVKLQERQKLTDNELLSALAKAGMQNIGAHKLHSLMQLSLLPGWFKTLMRSGSLTEAHGIAALPALAFPAVMEQLETDIDYEIKWSGAIAAKTITEQINHIFNKVGIDLNKKNRDGESDRLFPIEPCRKCDFYKKVSARELCMKASEYERKNSEALQLKLVRDAETARKLKESGEKPVDLTDPTSVTPRRVKPSADGLVAVKRLQNVEALKRAKFDVATCKGCPHKHAASHSGNPSDFDVGDHCFHPPCFEKKQAASGRQESRREKLREYFEGWLRPVVLEVAADRLSLDHCQGLLLWLASGAPESFTRAPQGRQRGDHAAIRTKPWLKYHKLGALPDFLPLTLSPTPLRELSRCAIQTMTRSEMRWLAQFINVKLTDSATLYRIDSTYLAMKRKAELSDLAKLGGLETIADLGVEELRQKLLEHDVRNRIGVPADIEAVYREPLVAHDLQDREDSFDDLAADELAEEMFCIGCGCSHTDPCETPTGPCGWLRKEWAVETGDTGKFQDLGVCSAPECKPDLKRWDSGDREPSQKAIAARQERMEMMGVGIAEEIEEAAAPKKKGSKAA